MPKLQIDGATIAEIDADLAKKLTDMADQHGTGKNYKRAGFPQAVPRKMRTPGPPPPRIQIDLEFDAKP